MTAPASEVTPTTTSDPVVACVGRLAEREEHGDGEDGAAAAERAQAEPDERAGDEGESETSRLGPHQVQPDLLGVVEAVVDGHERGDRRRTRNEAATEAR